MRTEGEGGGREFRTTDDDDDGVYYYNCRRLKLEGETESICVCTKEQTIECRDAKKPFAAFAKFSKWFCRPPSVLLQKR